MNLNTQQQDKPLILVADDDITVRMIAAECLKESGYEVVLAENGSEALELIEEMQPDAVMLDVIMPIMDGYHVCRKIRTMAGNENLPILMMTALDDVESIHAAYDAGATEFTAKPVNWTIESHRLHNLIRAAAAAKQIQISKQEWERTFNALDDVVIILDTDLNIVQANTTALAASLNPSEPILGRKCSNVFCHDRGVNKSCPIMDVLESGEKKVEERVNGCMAGTFLVSVFPILDDAGAVIRMVYMAKDITERQQMESEVRRAQKMEAVGTLSGGLAHDFNNLLQVIIGYATLASMKLKPEDSVYRQLEAIKEAAWRGNDITRQLLTVSRKAESKMQPLELNVLVRNVSRLLKSTIPKMIFQQMELAEDLSLVNADPAQIEQVLMNLAVNAQYAMAKGGSLIFETRNVELGQQYCRTHPNVEPGHYVVLSVTDTGCGIDQETQAHIFEPFFTTRSPNEGTGLGLAMVYGIVHKHKGHLLCYSEVNQGTTFKIYLPAFASGTAGVGIRQPQEQIIGGNELILLVDDDPGIQHIARKLLSSQGYRILMAPNGQEALDVYAKKGDEINMVILDLNMPIMGGIECLDNLRKKTPELPILLASGFALNEESENRLCNTVDYISKPYHEKEFFQKVRNLLNTNAPRP